ncbi:hypothetical protein QM588_05100 [Rhodococcus sp. IEGM 1354]|uniref:hypothetical protein n=1 Tax=Rhodococcus sp. IEGM 1354 TaxID=3047088 RepID=UPI0024B823D7|nr:hypothetical protein [Rhodococcus sp. IEGM 1354]MDI9929774.1 hypothetical protein [Rhodococcus sp. IEGM 1354]
MPTDRLEQLRQRPILALTGEDLRDLAERGYVYVGAFERWIRRPGYTDGWIVRQAMDATADEWDGMPVHEWCVRNYWRLDRDDFRVQLARRQRIAELVAS